MVAEQSMIQAIKQAANEAIKEALMVVREADNPVNNARPICTTPRSGGPNLKHPIFDWRATNKDHEVCNFETEVKNIFMTNNSQYRKLNSSSNTDLSML